MIQVQDVVDLMKFELDAEGSDRYLFDTDYKPAINSAVNWLVSVFNRAFETNKLSGENLRDLMKTRVWTVNSFSRFKFDEAVINEKLWSVLAIMPKPDVFPAQLPPLLPNEYTSQFMPDVAFVKSDFSASLMTVEKWNENKKNIFSAGNELLNNDLSNFAYLTEIDYSTDTTYLQDGEMEIRPSVAGEFIAMTYLKEPAEVGLITDVVEFPSSLRTILVQKALNFIAVKQGDQTTLYSITDKDVKELIPLIA